MLIFMSGLECGVEQEAQRRVIRRYNDLWQASKTVLDVGQSQRECGRHVLQDLVGRDSSPVSEYVVLPHLQPRKETRRTVAGAPHRARCRVKRALSRKPAVHD